MPRESKCRRVAFLPPVKAFKPVGVPLTGLQEVVLKVEEFEAIRLKSHLNLEQEACAQMMQISRPTFQRILVEAYSKIADALSNGKAIRIEGGSYCLGQGHCRRRERQLDHMEGCKLYDSGLELEASALIDLSQSNKIAVCSTGSEPSSLVHERFGRCSNFLIWQSDRNTFSVLDNPDSENYQSFGTDSAKLLIQAGVGVLIVNHIGPKAFMILQRANIHVYTGAKDKSITEAVKMFQTQGLTELESANS